MFPDTYVKLVQEGQTHDYRQHAPIARGLGGCLSLCLRAHRHGVRTKGRLTMQASRLGFRWRISGPPGPPLTLSLLFAEAVRAMVFRAAERRGLMPLPDAFHGGGEAPHTHAYWLAEDADADGLTDHVTLYAASGLPEGLIPVLAEGGEIALRLVSGTRLPGAPECWRLLPDWMEGQGPVRLFGPGRVWVSETPFVTPQWVWRERTKNGVPRPGRDIAGQVARELQRRGLPAPEVVEVLPGAGVVAPWIGVAGYARSLAGRRPPPDAQAAQIRIFFGQAVEGPLALGFAAHFGLGLLRHEK